MENQCDICKKEATEMYCQACIDDLIQQETERIQLMNSQIRQYNLQNEKLDQEIKRMQDIKQRQQTESLDDKVLYIQYQKIKLQQEISDLESQENQQLQELQQLKTKIIYLEKSEDDLWERIHNLSKKLYQLFQQNSVADNQLQQLNSELDRLNKLDVLNDLFRIYMQDDVATINGLALGKKGDTNIDWDEMNAAAGHLALLFAYVFRKYKYTTQKIEQIECNGSNSRIVSKDGKTFNLFCITKAPQQKEEEEFNDAFLLLYTEFQSFMNYMQEEVLLKRNIQGTLPYRMVGQKINENNINIRQIQNQKWQQWTEAVKKFMSNVKKFIEINAQFDQQL